MATTKADRDWLRDFAESERRWWNAGTERGRACKAALALLDERDALEAKEGSARETAMRWGRELQESAARIAALEAERDGLPGQLAFEREMLRQTDETVVALKQELERAKRAASHLERFAQGLAGEVGPWCDERTPVSAAPTGPTTRAVCSHPSWADNGYCHTCGQKVRGNRTEEFPLRTTAPPAPCCPVALETHGLSHGDACPAGAGKGTP